MPGDTHAIMLALHIALGFSGFVLGAVAIALGKFGRQAYRHRWVGRLYTVAMLGMALLSVPLSLIQNDYFLLSIDLLTLAWVVGGWIALRQALRVRSTNRQLFGKLIQTHIIFMGSSYIAAWTAFLVNARPLGEHALVFWLYALGPSVIGTLLITRSAARFAKPAPARS